MKRFSLPRMVFTTKLSILLIAFQVLFASSCSWVKGKRTLFGDDKSSAPSTSGNKVVPKEQYDELLNKYEALVKERQINKHTGTEAAQSTDSSAIDLIGKIKKVEEGELAETVNVFDESKKTRPELTSTMVDQLSNKIPEDSQVEFQMNELRKATNLINSNKLGQGLKILKTLEMSSILQVKVRSKFLIGEILFKQGEYDLALQIFEEVISKYAFSGLVIKTLGRLIVCTEKLKLSKKQERYYSVLHDFFDGI